MDLEIPVLHLNPLFPRAGMKSIATAAKTIGIPVTLKAFNIQQQQFSLLRRIFQQVGTEGYRLAITMSGDKSLLGLSEVILYSENIVDQFYGSYYLDLPSPATHWGKKQIHGLTWETSFS